MGKPGLAITSRGYCECGILSILLGNGDGTFAELTHRSVGKGPEGSIPYEIVALDLNQDTHLDLAIANFGDVRSGGLALLMGSGDGRLPELPSTPDLGIPLVSPMRTSILTATRTSS